MEDWTSKAVTLNHIRSVQFPCCCQSLRNDVVDDNTFGDLCVSFSSSSSHLRIAPRLYTCDSILFLPLSLGSPPVYRKSSWPTNKRWPQSSTDRQETERQGRTARLLQNFAAWSLHNAYSPHLSGSTVFQKRSCVCMNQTTGEALDTKHTLGLTEAVFL